MLQRVIQSLLKHGEIYESDDGQFRFASDDMIMAYMDADGALVLGDPFDLGDVDQAEGVEVDDATGFVEENGLSIGVQR